MQALFSSTKFRFLKNPKKWRAGRGDNHAAKESQNNSESEDPLPCMIEGD
jgi:hypothetical protein